jgi:uncharacterized protein (DUF433 family)
MAGKPVIRDTRVPVDLILRMLAQGISEDEILAEYPRLERADLDEVRMREAVKRYQSGHCSSGRAAELAGVTRVEFLLALGRYQVPLWSVDEETLAQDISNA